MYLTKAKVNVEFVYLVTVTIKLEMGRALGPIP
jgi:hypothetical protein